MASIQVILDNGLKRFASVVRANRTRVRAIWLVTPWLSAGDHADDPINDIIDSLRGRRCTIYLATRPPTSRWHAHAIELIDAALSPIILYSDLLHAKLYLLECDGFRYAMLGSPNLTERAASTNIEIGIELRTGTTRSPSGVAEMISQLAAFARSLLTEEHVHLRPPCTKDHRQCRL